MIVTCHHHLQSSKYFYSTGPGFTKIVEIAAWVWLGKVSVLNLVHWWSVSSILTYLNLSSTLGGGQTHREINSTFNSWVFSKMHWILHNEDVDCLSLEIGNWKFYQWPYFIKYNVHTSIVRTWISQWFFAKKNYFYFSRIISKELIIASLFIIKAILNPFSATFHV